MPWWDREPAAPYQSVARWSGGRKWGDGVSDGSVWWYAITGVEQDSGQVWNFEVAIGGAIQAWASISFKRGREDWFSTLAATNCTITVNGYAIPEVGASVVIGEANELLWVGTVDFATADQKTDGTWVTSISCVDTIGRLGKAEVKGASIPSGTLVTQVEYLLGLAGIDATVEQDAGIALPTLDAVTFTGAVLDHIARAERSSNALLFMRPNGDLRVTQRVALPDYGARVVAGLYAPVPSSHWRLDEASGNAADAMSVATGTVTGTLGYQVEGPFGTGSYGIEWDGTNNEYFDFGDVYDFTGTQPFTLMGWLRWDGTQAGCIFDKRDNTSQNGYSIQVTSDGRFKGVRAVSGVEVITQTEAGVVPSDGSWVHMAFVYDGTTLRIVANGAPEAEVADARSLSNHATSAKMGRLAWANSERFDGALSQFSLWNGTALTDDEVRALLATDAIDVDSEGTSPSSWSVRLSQDTIYNAWQLTKEDSTVVLDEQHAESIAAYGLRAYTVSGYLLATYAHFPSGLRDALDHPRLVLAGATFPIKGYENWRIMGIEPLDLISRDGHVFQVMSVDHQITPQEWTISITGDSTRDDLSSETIVAAPVDPPEPPATPGTKTVTVTFEATRDSTAYLSSGSARYGNGTGDRLQVGYYAGGRGRAFVRWPITWPTGTIRVVKAYVKFRVGTQKWVAFGSSPRVYLQRIKDSWSEGSYDAAPPNQFSANALIWPGPSRSSVGQKAVDVPTVEGRWVQWAITEIADDWRVHGNDGLALTSVNEDSSSRTTEFYSRESGSEPVLVLTVEVPA